MIRPLIALMLLTFASPAFAQDKDDADWSGPYVAISAGGDSKQASTSETVTFNQTSNLFVPGRGIIVVPATSFPVAGSDSQTGFSGGVALGWLGQSKHFVYGLEIGGAFNKSSAVVSVNTATPLTALVPVGALVSRRTIDNDFDVYARLKFGYATGKTLFFVTGGVAGTRAGVTAVDTFSEPGGPAAPCGSPPGCTTANFSAYGPAITTFTYTKQNMIGWTAGAGLEQKLSKNFSIGLDFMHKDFGAKTFTPNSATTSFANVIRDSNGNIGTNAQALPGTPRVALRDDRVAVTLAFHF